MICDRSKDWGLTSTKLNVSSETSADFPIANSDFQILYKLWRNVGLQVKLNVGSLWQRFVMFSLRPRRKPSPKTTEEKALCKSVLVDTKDHVCGWLDNQARGKN